jgi:predicted nucleic acid-binding protein
MNVGEMKQYFIDSNIWLYRFIVNTNDANSIKKQQIANPENPKILEILIQTNSRYAVANTPYITCKY